MKILRMIIIGILIALSSSYILVTISILPKANVLISGEELLNQILIAAILGTAIGLLSLLFELERLSFLLQLALHLMGVTSFVLIAGYFGQWFKHFGIGNVLISEAIIYVIVWSMMYLLQKKDVEQINAAIQKRKEQ
ncbi:DUF3021 domain-containing protein [Metasolibacillus meyeri]|uniref:DUF3021 domain-containing protein n=1 Tax=Metasolibacillus meyeri TaxID=1071052 RepID=A0AAW9NW04_9BACL|nr:DUF3021 domain-containing protein [Metasolibacillus meyeri]MEC1179664.1 DUF3021 domain-containing protein [Metasolibacillus meyeri]